MERTDWVNLTDKLRELGDNQRRLKDTMWTTRYRQFDDDNLVKKVSSRNICKIFNQGTYINLLHPRALEYLNELKKEFGSAYADWVDSLSGNAIVPTGLDKEYIRHIVDQEEQNPGAFTVDFDLVWQAAGYANKGGAKKSLLKSGMVEGQDFCSFIQNDKREIGATQVEKISFTLDAAKHFLMLAKTEQGKLVRQYFIEAEKNMKRLIKQREQEHLMTIAQLENQVESLGFPRYERTVCNALERYWKAKYQVERNVYVTGLGKRYYIDFVLSDRIIVEVKRVENWREALTQIKLYDTLLKKARKSDQEYEKWIYLFGTEIPQEDEDLIREVLADSGTFVWFHTDINQLPDRR